MAIPIRTESKYVVNPEQATTQLHYLCSMGIYSTHLHKRQSKIICSIGPVSRDPDILEKMIEAGMDIARIILGRGTYEYHIETIQNIRTAVTNYSKKIGRPHPLPIATDIKGAEIRTGTLENKMAEIELITGNLIKVTIDKMYAEKCNDQIIYVDYDNITKVVAIGSKICINHGYIILVVEKIYGNCLDCIIKIGGILQSDQGVNLPGTKTDLPHLSDRDKQDIQFSVAHDIDILFLSFVRSAQGIIDLKKCIGDKGKDISVIAKVENQEGMDNFETILQEADGMLVARGDMGIEIAIEKVFLAQKFEISVCNQRNKPVIVAAQLMDSMTKNSRPTRSEASDVANTVLDGVDCLTLTNETTKGEYPLESVKTMAEICREAEAAIWQKQIFRDLIDKELPPIEAHNAIAMCAVLASVKMEAAAIIIITASGRSSYTLSKYKPRCPILAVTRNAVRARQMMLYRGVMPLIYPYEKMDTWIKDLDDRVQFAIKVGQNEGFIKVADPVIVVTGWKQGLGFTNTLRIIFVPAVAQSIVM